MGGVFEVKNAALEDEYVVLVQWQGLDDGVKTWGPASRDFEDALAMLEKEIRKVHAYAVIKKVLKDTHGV